MSTEKLNVIDIFSSYDQTPVLKRLTLRLYEGEIGCVLGPSGCGKSTLLRAIAGFSDITSGEIHITNRLVNRAGWKEAPQTREVGIVFQDGALFPHLTVHKNIGFGLHKWPRSIKNARITQLLKLMQIDHLKDRYPHEISGGEQQRVALARAIAPKPQLLLMDEPFSNLDPALREQLSKEVRKLLKAENITALLVTHNQQEACCMADKVGVMKDGQIAQWDNPATICIRPNCKYVGEFMAKGNESLEAISWVNVEARQN